MRSELLSSKDFAATKSNEVKHSSCTIVTGSNRSMLHPFGTFAKMMHGETQKSGARINSKQ